MLDLNKKTWVLDKFNKLVPESYKAGEEVWGNIEKLELKDFNYLYVMYKGGDKEELTKKLKELWTTEQK